MFCEEEETDYNVYYNILYFSPENGKKEYKVGLLFTTFDWKKYQNFKVIRPCDFNKLTANEKFTFQCLNDFEKKFKNIKKGWDILNLQNFLIPEDDDFVYKGFHWGKVKVFNSKNFNNDFIMMFDQLFEKHQNFGLTVC